jgi:hypothetical protein
VAWLHGLEIKQKWVCIPKHSKLFVEHLAKFLFLMDAGFTAALPSGR